MARDGDNCLSFSPFACVYMCVYVCGRICVSRSARTTRIPPIEINKGTTRIVKYCTTFIVTDAVLDQDRGGLRERVSRSTFLSVPLEFPSRGKVKENGTGMRAVCVCVCLISSLICFHLEGGINVTFASH